MKSKRLLIGLGGVLAVLFGLIALFQSGSQTESDKAASTDSQESRQNEKPQEPPEPGEIPLPNVALGRCRIYTTPPGFVVLVDGEPARDKQGKLSQTPCAIQAPSGTHTVTVARKGYADISKTVGFQEDTQVVFSDLSESSNASNSILQAPYFQTPVGKPIPLNSLNTPGRELDPYITPDGLSIWFAGDRSEGKGVYVATRPSPWHEFSEPQLLLLTRSSDLPGSPSITGDSRTVVYTVPRKARIFGLTRPNPLADFTDKKPLHFQKTGGAVWPSAQILSNGLKLYWVEEEKGKTRTLSISREKRNGEFTGTVYRVDFPGTHPCLSHDGLRQYAFDGQKLQRARRRTINSRFSQLETIAQLDLPNYTPHPQWRQFFVSNDEQWLFYCDDPEQGGDLHMVRLSKGPGWGPAPRGTKIPPRREMASTEKNPDNPEKSAEPPPDPRTLPLPYTAFRQQFTTLMKERKYQEARQLLQKATKKPELSKAQEFLDYDLQDWQRIDGFWNDVNRVLQNRKPGDTVRLNNIKLSFVGFEDGTLRAKSKTVQVEKNVSELEAVPLIDLVEDYLDRNDPQVQLRMATFLYYESPQEKRRIEVRLERAGEQGSSFLQQLASRKLDQARKELDRGRFSQGRQFLLQTLEQFPETQAAQQARQLRQKLYTFIEWKKVGPRQWQEGELGQYTAPHERAPDSYLLSPKQYQNFELSLEWKITDELGQGGVYFRYPGQGSPYENAFKIQFADDAGPGSDKYSTGSLFAVQAPEENASLPRGQWNTLELQVRGSSVQATINGKKVLQTLALDADIPKKGYVALDGVTGGIAYRKILLTELPASQ